MMFGYNTWEDFTPLDKIKELTHIKSPYIVVHIYYLLYRGRFYIT